MDVSKWPLHKRMALPDWCFGQKWWIGTSLGTTADTSMFFFIEEHPPDIFVVWDVFFFCGGVVAALRTDLTICLCNELPVATNIRTLTRLLRQFGKPGEYYDMHFGIHSAVHIGPMKVLVEANNQGIGGAFKLLGETANCESSLAVLVSTLPKEVPDWAVSGLAGRR